MVTDDASRFGLRHEVLEGIINAIAKQSSINIAYIFGSRARGDNRYNSDIDLAIGTCGGIKAVLSLLSDLDEVPTLCSFDVVNINDNSNMSIKERVLLEGVCIYKRVTGAADECL